MNFKYSKYLIVGGISAALLSVIVGSNAKNSPYDHAGASDVDLPMMAVDTPETPDGTTPVTLPYPYSDQSTGDPLNYPNSGGLMLNNPSNVTTNVEYNPATGNYDITQKIGGMNYRPPTYMENEEFQDYQFKKQTKSYWNQRSHAESQNAQTNTTIPKLRVGGEVFDRIFGGNTVDIRPNGSAELIFAYQGTNTENPALPEKQRKISTFDFDEKIQLNVVGKIGDKLKLTTSYNTEATFDYENQMKLEYTGYEDEIIKKIEAGNVSLPLNGSLITGSQTLFGVKTQLQFGRLTVTSILSQQKGKKSEVEVTGGAQVSKYEVAGDAYEYNRHFFLSQFFRDQFNTALSGLPFINSGVSINRIEVWVTNTNGATNDIRNGVAFSDLGEDGTHVTQNTPYIHDTDPSSPGVPYNDQNDLYKSMVNLGGVDAAGQPYGTRAINAVQATIGSSLKPSINYLVQNMRKLQPSEYTLNSRLGFVSLNQQLNPEQVLAVAFQYTYEGKTYNVGEFSDGGISAPSTLFLKMLKSDAPNTRFPIWNLMMKNVYSIGAYQVNSKDFKLDVFYTNSATGTDINYLPVSDCQTAIKGKPLLQVLNLDRLNGQDQTPDGVFDYVDGVTINSNNGRVIFPVVEPFGDFLRSKFRDECDAAEANKYVFDPLYDSTKTSAQQFPNLNRYKIKGQYQSASGSEISLGAPNVPQGSVTVTAGGVQLTENVDYTVDYTLGRLKIVNEGILNSGTPIKISLESNALFAIQSKTLFGTHLDYKINKDFNVGATVLSLTERPLTKKVNQGDEPIRNTIWGFDGNYRTDAPFLTRLIDKLPFLETKEMSTITAAGEFAYLIPGHSKAIGKDGNSYVDDFEGSQSTIDLRQQGSWNLASTPQGQPNLFPEADSANSLAFGYNRAKLNWYVIDNILQRKQNITPDGISPSDMSNNFTREIPETEVFPNKQSPTGQVSTISTLDLAYYPSERGPYNYNVDSTAQFAGLSKNGLLNSPTTRWGGIMRAISTNDFEATNIEYIQFWMMDPFNNDNTNKSTSGELYFNLGNVSEDVLRDGYRSAENVLPAPSTSDQNNGQNLPTITTAWGSIPTVQPLVNAFNADEGDRSSQDVGLDGKDDAGEQSFFSNYLSRVSVVAPGGYSAIRDDPSADDFHYFRGSDYVAPGTTILDRYKKWNGLEQNSRTTAQSPESYPTPGPTSGTPNSEDINRDNNLSTTESYFQYHISLKQSDICELCIGTNYITDVYKTTGQNIKDGSAKPITWYQFKIPIKVPEARVGTIENFQSIRFMRVFFKGVDKPIVLRFARLELVRGEWRKFGFDLLSPGYYVPNDDPTTQFDIGAVNIEENGSKSPVNYVLPPGIEREQSAASANLIQQNEQALSLTVCNLQDGKARAAYKNTSLDVRSYKKLKMYVHAEASPDPAQVLRNNDLRLFVRLGTDFTDNYYEYEIPLAVTAPGSYNGTNEDDQYRVWPSDNEMILEFEKLQSAKQKRNIAMFGSAAVTLTSEFAVPDGTRTITVKGNPNLSAIKTIMIGVRNPKRGGPGESDDGQPKCGQIWVNELRLSDFDDKGGWAANARVTAKLADFGSVSVSGNMYTPGFGSIENKVSERKRETLKQYDVSSSLELGKFIPEDYNIHIPMYVGYSETFITPQYNPLDPDILLAPTLKDPTIPKAQRDSLKHVTQDYTKRRGINFTNVKKDKGKGAKKSHIYDVENWAASYSYNELYRRNVNIEYNSQHTYRGGLNYNYAPQPKNIRPFAKTKLFQSKYLLLIKDINFYPYPNKIGFSTDVNRDYSTSKGRNTTTDDIIILPTFNKTFNMNRNYDLKYDVTKNLKVDFTASNQERILEPDGAVTDQSRDTLRKEFFNRLTKTQYNHQVSVNYNIPINKLPLLDFTTASVRYAGTYSWQHSPFYDTHHDAEGNVISNDTLGNTIQNSRNISWNGQLNMVTLYNKIPYFKKVNQKGTQGKNSKGGKGAPAIKNNGGKTPADSTKKEDNFEILEYIARLIMTVKTVNVTYADNAGTLLPGYAQNTQLMGMDEHFQGPTTGFIFGSQKDIRGRAIATTEDNDPNNDWLVKTASLNTAYTTTSSQNLNIRANAEPFPNLKIELTATRTQSKSQNEFFRWSDVRDQFVHDAPQETGSFSISYLTYRTSFRKNGDETFQAFLDARPNISARLGAENPNSTTSVNGYAEGYNETSQDVLIPSFLAAYSGKNPNGVSLNPMPKVPKPNWRITYDGLSKLEKIKKYFKSFTLSHAYRSSYNVGGYTSNLLFDDSDGDGYTAIRESVSSIANNPNFLSRNQIYTVTISEQWSPFIKLEMTMNNSVLVNFEYKKDRNLSLGLTSKTVTELTGREIIGGLGYRIRELKLGKLQIKGKPLKSDLNLKADISFRRNETVMRRIVEEVSQSTGGTNIISLKISADYVISEKINIRLFYDRIINKPVISTSFPTTNTNAGVSLRLTLSN